MDSNDIIRERILEYLYQLNQDSRSPDGALAGIQKIQLSLKQSYQYNQKNVASNLNYLIDRNWVLKQIKTKDFTTEKGTTVHPESTKYRITADGIDYIEGPSKFENKQIFSNININHVSGVVVVGNSNSIVNKNYEKLFNDLTTLQRKILENKKFDDEQKLNISSDVESLKNQLSKTSPDKPIIKKLWSGIETSVTLAEFSSLLSTISSAILSFFQ